MKIVLIEVINKCTHGVINSVFLSLKTLIPSPQRVLLWARVRNKFRRYKIECHNAVVSLHFDPSKHRPFSKIIVLFPSREHSL